MKKLSLLSLLPIFLTLNSLAEGKSLKVGNSIVQLDTDNYGDKTSLVILPALNKGDEDYKLKFYCNSDGLIILVSIVEGPQFNSVDSLSAKWKFNSTTQSKVTDWSLNRNANGIFIPDSDVNKFYTLSKSAKVVNIIYENWPGMGHTATIPFDLSSFNKARSYLHCVK